MATCIASSAQVGIINRYLHTLGQPVTPFGIILLNLCRSAGACAKFNQRLFSLLMPRSHIHGSPRRFHYGLNLTDDPGNASFRSPIRMHNGVATGFDLSTKDKIEKKRFGDRIDTVCYGLVRNATV